MTRSEAPELQELAKNQFIAKLQVKKNHLSDQQKSQFETIVGQPPADFAKALAVELERNRFREQDLQTAWHEAKNEDIAARIIGFIRQAALGEALIPWEQRVDQALTIILAQQN